VHVWKLKEENTCEEYRRMVRNNVEEAECKSINQSCIFRVVQVTKSLQDALEVGNNLPGITENVRE